MNDTVSVVERIAVWLWQDIARAPDRQRAVTALLNAGSEMNRLFCRICSDFSEPDWLEAAEMCELLSDLAFDRAAALGPLNAEPAP